MSQRFRGAVIKATPPSPTSSAASAIWTLQQQAQFSSTWPVPSSAPSPGGLWVWGRNTHGALGLNDTVHRSSPVQVGALATWSTISCVGLSAAAIKTDGTLWTWGQNAFGQLGQSNVTYLSSPVQVGALTNWSKVSIDRAMMAIKTDGSLWACGRGNFGLLGLGSTTSYNSPKQVGALTNWAMCRTQSYLCVATKTDGTMWSWGKNNFGQLGQNSYFNTYVTSPKQIGALTTWSKAYVSSYNGIAIKTDGTLWTWGSNQFYGQLGQNNTINRSSPVQIGADTNWSYASAGYTQFGIKTTGTLWAIGKSALTAQNNTTDLSSPVQVGALTTWRSIKSRGATVALALKTDNTLWSWGSGNYGGTGQNNSVTLSSPVQIGALATWQSIYAGANNGFGIKT